MIEIINLTTNPIDEEFLKRVSQKVLKEEKKERSNLSIVFVDQGRMKELNKRYLGKNRTTDVLAFGQNQKSKIKNQKFVEPLLGEIVICLEEVRKNAKRFQTTFEKELTRVLIHGILHLLDYNHEKSLKKAKLMEERENFYLNQIFAKI